MPKTLIPSIKEVSAIKSKRIVLAAGLLAGLSAPGYGLWPLAWMALVPWLCSVSVETQPRPQFLKGFLFGFLFQTVYCLWFWDLHPVTWLGFSEVGSLAVTGAGWLLLGLEGGLICGLLALAFAGLLKKERGWRGPDAFPWLTVLIFPALWVIGFALLNKTPLSMPWGLLEYTQADQPILRWLAGWISASGVAYLLVLHNSCWALFALRGTRVKNILLGLCLVPVLLLGMQLPPVNRMAQTESGWPIPVAVVQGNIPIEVVRSAGLTLSIIEQSYLRPLETGNFQRNTLVVLPEEGVVPGWVSVEEPLEHPLVARLHQTAVRKQVSVAVGVSSRDETGKKYNSIALIPPDSAQRIRFYHKRKLVPFGEYTPYGGGTALSTLLAAFQVDYYTPYDSGNEAAPLQWQVDGQTIRAGGLICFELIDAEPGNRGMAGHYQREKADLLLNVSNLGWFHGNRLLEAQFLAIGRMRAAESWLPLVMASNTGVSAILDAQGATLKQIQSDSTIPFQPQIIRYNSSR